MKPKAIGYSHTYQVGLSNFEKIWYEAELEEGDDPRKCLYEAKRIVDSFHFESNKAAEKQALVQDRADTPPDRPKDIEGGIVYDIEHCSDPKVLDTYKFFLAKYPKTKIAYDNQLKKLQ